MLLISTFALYPGVGCVDPMNPKRAGNHHNAMHAVIKQLQELAKEIGIDLPDYSIHTIRKDLKILRHYRLLDRRPYRYGYYLGTGALNREELQVALNALQSQAEYQQDPQISQIYQRLTRRLGGLHQQSELFYPVRAHIAHSIVYTNPEEMMSRNKYRETLFEKMEELELAIVKGQAIQLLRCRSPTKIEAPSTLIFIHCNLSMRILLGIYYTRITRLDTWKYLDLIGLMTTLRYCLVKIEVQIFN